MSWTDIDTLVELEQRLFVDDAWSARTWWSELAGRPQRVYLVAQDDDRVVGYAGLSVAGDVADVMTIAVAPGAQGTGVGRLLLEELVAQASAAAVSVVLLEVRSDNDPARKLYERNGFEQIGVRRRYYQPGDIDALVMRRHLRQEETRVD
ncbi:ribosomal protein S18-alanine N-acetyltransferase [Allobranchiibius sp. GilTou38]|uniref:ribosomal protein S18-alanine N-acetyltransferase n=1 Tax=Allobranchiibius sp. GilTou38 TaxID=2815210 RepID=UPI001AA0E5A9|nr:ribosomal protein S18-alanine N-acetyltransferase [Allobranchiibius sp. GilTou38]MBO1768471.1 ribosomal protein S18-alanine N-acetyltransferase [Allobranchiibius sp. GilTou38]